MSSQEYLLCLFFPDYDAFLMGVTLRNGQVTSAATTPLRSARLG